MHKIKELRSKTEEELNTQLDDLLRDAFLYRTQKATDQLNQTHLLKQNRRNVARIKTLLNEKKRERV